ncbi:MAG: lipase family protein [Sphingobacteriales bacterium]|jgi:hypothetical protein|nr:MAG: lipase family protein [Sphingobacteriales bacterium]
MIKNIQIHILFLFVFAYLSAFAQTNCFSYFNTNNAQQNDTIAYLLMDCNYYIFPDLIGVKKYKDDSAFQAMFSNKYSEYGMQQFSFINNYSTSTNLIVMSNHNTIIIIFRGSETKGGFKNTKRDWLRTDAKCKMYKVDTFNNSYVHKGFWNSYTSIEDTLVKTLYLHQHESKKIFITGHSLGGALSVLAAANLYQHNIKPFGVYLFANPRVGTTYFADFYNTLNIPTFRYVNENDLVPMLPPTNAFRRIYCPEPKNDCGKYQHVGNIYNISKDTIVANDNEMKVPNKTYKMGKIRRHIVGEYCRKIYQIYFPNDTIGLLPKPPTKKKKD